ncbi:MAG: site-2 protease family protein [Solirubrobacterales bacterium]|nr:site-2 protease family protein [Solirubrobacterales bacterium]
MFGGGRSFTLFKVRGIRVTVDWSWFIVLFLVIFWLSDFYGSLLGVPNSSTEPYLLAVASAAGFFGSIVLHELGHAFMAARNGIGITRISLWIFGGVAQMDRESDSPGTEFQVAIGGPVVTALIAAVLFAIGILTVGWAEFRDTMEMDQFVGTSGVIAMVGWLAAVNLIVLFFNLLPAFPMDGGRIVRSIAWKITGKRSAATRFAAGLGRIFGYLFIGLGLLLAVRGSVFSGVWLALIGVLITGSARAATVQTNVTSRLDGIKVGDIMDEHPVAIPATTSVDQALDEYFLRYQWSWFPVVDGGNRFLGMIIRDQVDQVPETDRTSTTVSEHLELNSRAFHISEEALLESLLGNPDMRKFGALMVTDHGGQLAGVVTVEQLGRALKP